MIFEFLAVEKFNAILSLLHFVVSKPDAISI